METKVLTVEKTPYNNVNEFDYSTFEGALEAGLKEALNLIKKKL